MKYQLFLFFAAAILIVSCHTIGNHSTDDTEKAKIIHLDNLLEKNVVPTVWVMNDSLIKMDFVNAEKGTIASAEGALNGENKIAVEVNVGQADSLLAEISQPNSGHEIVFSRIRFRGIDTEGVSGNALHMGISQPGTYQLLITQKRSATSAGKFKIKVWLK